MLADALGIYPEAGEKAARGAPVTYREEVQEFAWKDLKFLALVEAAFAPWVFLLSSEHQTTCLTSCFCCVFCHKVCNLR